MSSRKVSLTILLVLLLLHSGINSYTLANSSIARVYDDAGRIREGVIISQKLSLREGWFLFNDLVSDDPNHPKLFIFVEGIILYILNAFDIHSIEVMILIANSIFFLVLLLSVYGIGRIVVDEKTGILSAALISFSPIIFAHSRMSMLDFPLTAMVSLSFFSLLRTERFTSSLSSLVSGICFGLTQLVKETAILFLLPPLLYYFILSLIKSVSGIKKVMVNFSLLTVAFAVIAVPIYFNSESAAMLRVYFGKAFSIHHAPNNLNYAECFPLIYVGKVSSAALLPLVTLAIFRLRSISAFLIVWLTIPFILFSFSPNKDPRFLMPILPAFFLIFSFLAVQIKPLWFKKWYIFIILNCFIFQYLIFNFFFSTSAGKFINDDLDSKIPARNSRGLLAVEIDSRVDLVRSLLDVFKEEHPFYDENRVIFTFDTGVHCALEIEFRKKHLPFFVNVPQQYDSVDIKAHQVADWSEYVLTADYIVNKIGNLNEEESQKSSIISKSLKEGLNKYSKIFYKIKSFQTKEGEWIYIYRKRIKNGEYS